MLLLQPAIFFCQIITCFCCFKTIFEALIVYHRRPKDLSSSCK
uniref:Uncharacterized protein n=1 Tax=uncultured alpha proteobacterium HF0130_20P23 TaxID=710809 RepID=E0XTB4_9PROT|nr:hypothetical protein [uncultured alpha proteobacterium HF0130_20P23]